MSFERTLSIKSELTADISQEIRIFALDVNNRLVTKTPFRDGFAKAGWLTSISAPSDFIPTTPDSISGAATIQKNSGIISTYPSDKLPVMYIQNNLPYIGKLNEGSSEQAPAKFVEIAIDKALANG